MPSLLSLTFLGWRALVVQPLKRLAHRGTGLARFQAAYGPDGLGPTRLEDREVSLLASRCTGCGLCEAGCLLPGAAPELRALGLPAVFRLVGKQSADLPLGRDLLTRVLYGGRISVLVGLLVVGISISIGVPIGALAGYYGGRLDAILDRKSVV